MSADEKTAAGSPDAQKLRRSFSFTPPGTDRNNNSSLAAPVSGTASSADYAGSAEAMQLVKADSLMGLLRLPAAQTTRLSSSSSELAAALPARQRSGLSEVKIKHQFFTLSLLEFVCNLLNSNNAKFADLQFKEICNHLVQYKIVNAKLTTEVFRPIRSVYQGLLVAIFNQHRQVPRPIEYKPSCVQRQTSKTKINKVKAERVTPSAAGTDDDAGQDSLLNESTSLTFNEIALSRYSSEFVEIKKLAAGAFGTVYHARNILDQNDYAVKKIYFRQSTMGFCEKVLRETRLFSSLNHENIVNYHNSWLEINSLNSNQLEMSKKIMKSDENEHSEFVDDNYLDEDELDEEDEESSEDDDDDDEDEESKPVKPRNADSLSLDADNKNDSIMFADEIGSQGSKSSSSSTREAPTTTTTETSSSSSASRPGLFQRQTSGASNFSSFSTNAISFSTPEAAATQPIRIMNLKHDPEKELDAHFGKAAAAAAESETSEPSRQQRMRNRKLKKEKKLLRQTGDLVILYIQMRLCDFTLKHWIKQRNVEFFEAGHKFLDESQVGLGLNLFKQILKAVDYIHSKFIIHRDLKPGNIFILKDDMQVKVGDFGLARIDMVTHTKQDETLVPAEPGAVARKRSSSSISEIVGTPRSNNLIESVAMIEEIYSDELTKGVGTSLYASPEQLTDNNYDIKSDMYSLGIILFELLWPFNTDMHRYKDIHQLKKHGILPDGIEARFPKECAVIKSLVSRNPSERPTAFDLLNSELFLSKDQIIENLRRSLLEKDNQIKQLNDELSDKTKLLEKFVKQEKFAKKNPKQPTI